MSDLVGRGVRRIALGDFLGYVIGAVEGSLEVIGHLLDSGRIAIQRAHCPYLQRTVGNGRDLGGAHLQAVQRQYAGHEGQQTDTIGRSDGENALVIEFGHRDVNSRHPGQRELLRRKRGWLWMRCAGQCRMTALDEFMNEISPPVTPCCGTGSHGVCLDKSAHEIKQLMRVEYVGDRRNRGRIIKISPSRSIGKYQVIAHQRHDGRGVIGIEPEHRTQLPGDLSTYDAVIPRPTLTDVMQQRRHEQKIGSLDISSERTGLHGSLDEVSINSEPVNGVALRS